MKGILFLLITLSVNCYSFSQSNFDRGFDAGYKKGYCHNKGLGCIPPIAPIAPIPKIGEDVNSYQDGYDRGFSMGLSGEATNDRKRYTTSTPTNIDYTSKCSPNDVVALANTLKEAKGKAIDLQEAGDNQGSINIAKAGLRINPRDGEFLMICAVGYLNLEDYENATVYLKKVVTNSDDLNAIKMSREVLQELESGEYQRTIQEGKRQELK